MNSIELKNIQDKRQQRYIECQTPPSSGLDNFCMLTELQDVEMIPLLAECSVSDSRFEVLYNSDLLYLSNNLQSAIQAKIGMSYEGQLSDRNLRCSW